MYNYKIQIVTITYIVAIRPVRRALDCSTQDSRGNVSRDAGRKTARLKISGKFLTDMNISPLKIGIMLESSPLKSRIL